MSKLRKAWKFLNSPIGEVSAEAVKSGVDVVGKVFELANTLQEQSEYNEQIQELVNQIPTLLEVLNSPWGKVANSTVPFLGIATGLLKFSLEATKKEPTLVECIALVTQSAYLKSLCETLKEEDELLQQTEKPVSEATKQQLRQLAELELTEKEAKLAFVYFPDSELAKAFNGVVITRLESAGVETATARNWAERIAANTPRYIEDALASAGEETKKLLDWYKAGGKDSFEKYLSIDTYLEDEILKLPDESVFKEEFCFRDIYVPLKAAPLDKNGKEIEDADTPLLEEWTKGILEDETKKQQVIFIQAAAGRGKSVFCRMFAAWVAQNLHPRLTPILIRLRDIEVFEGNFETILSNALIRNFVTNDNGWLTDRNTHFLFILDGFDELRIERGSSGGVKEFIEKVESFQRRSQTSETGHRVIITGRPLALQGISLPPNLERVKLLEMDDDLRQQWLENWQKVVKEDPEEAAAETEAFRNFLEAEECPEAVKDELAREPLLLYLLARMHRDANINLEDLRGSNATTAKIIIYEKCLKAVLLEQRGEWLQSQITGLETEELENNLERILTESGLCVVQSGGEFAKVTMIESRLEMSDSEASQLIKGLREKQGEKALTNALGAFYLRPAAGDKGGGVEFYHKSFGEFLCAKRLQASLEEWTTEVKIGRRKQLYVDDSQLCWQIYDLLGYGGLTPEIVEYLMGLLKRSDEFKPVKLFERLEYFYWRWCDGEFIDADKTTFPQDKMRQLKTQLPEQETYLGQRQVDVYAGLNMMILLLELHRYGKEQPDLDLIFYPCGKPDAKNKLKHPRLLLRLIGYSECLGNRGFFNTMGGFLISANLSGADLNGANLSEADFRNADLRNANLRNAYLFFADLRNANLRNANLFGANLFGEDFFSEGFRNGYISGAYLNGANLSESDLRNAYLFGANLSGANLSGADFNGANLFSADLSGANLSESDLSGADLENIIWDEQTDWNEVKGLETARNVPEALKQQLSLT